MEKKKSLQNSQRLNVKKRKFSPSYLYESKGHVKNKQVTFQYESASSTDSSESESDVKQKHFGDTEPMHREKTYKVKSKKIKRSFDRSSESGSINVCGNELLVSNENETFQYRYGNKNSNDSSKARMNLTPMSNMRFENTNISARGVEEDGEVEDGVRIGIRKELSQMSFEELQKLKEKLGSKVYNEAVFGKREKKRQTNFKRENKNRPRETSSKIPVPKFREVVPLKRTKRRDPRFDDLCGAYDEKAFKSAFSFLDDIRAKEKEELKKHLKEEKDPERVKQIKYLLQRMGNQERQEIQKKELEVKRRQEKEAQIAMLREGKKPFHLKKSERRLLDLADRYENLKASGGLKKHVMKQRKRNAQKDRKKVFA